MSSETFGFDEFISALNDLESDFKQASVTLLEETGNHAVTETQARTPVGNGTPEPGRLRRSISRGEVVDYEVEIGTDVPYADYVENGTRHIRPRYMMRDGVTVAEKRFKTESKKVFDKVTKGFDL